MTGCSNSTFQVHPLTVLICLAATLCSVSCKDEEPMLDAGPRALDAGTSTDAGDIADAGPAPDTGPELRTMTTRQFVPGAQANNHMLAPDFDLGMFNLGWSSGGIEGGQARLTKYVDLSAPGARPQWVQIADRTSAAGGAFLVGFGHAPAGPLRIEVWLAQTETATAPGDGVEIGLHGVDLPGETRALLLEPEPGDGIIQDGWRWRRWAAEDTVRWVGFTTLVVFNRSATPLAVGTATLQTAPQQARSGALGGRQPQRGRLRALSPAHRRVLAEAWQRQRRAAPSPEAAAEMHDPFSVEGGRN